MQKHQILKTVKLEFFCKENIIFYFCLSNCNNFWLFMSLPFARSLMLQLAWFPDVDLSFQPVSEDWQQLEK